MALFLPKFLAIGNLRGKITAMAIYDFGALSTNSTHRNWTMFVAECLPKVRGSFANLFVSRLSEAYPSGPDPFQSPPSCTCFGPAFVLIQARFPHFHVKIRSKTGRNVVHISSGEGFGAGSCPKLLYSKDFVVLKNVLEFSSQFPNTIQQTVTAFSGFLSSGCLGGRRNQ